jgi:hypothetical protein
MAESPDLADLLLELDAFILGKVSVSLPGTILEYDQARQVATVKPTVSARRHEPETNALIPEALPAIANVPVLFPVGLGGAASFTWPLAAGDTVLLVICDRSIDEWKATGLPENVPVDIRRFDLTDAVALAGLHPNNRPIPASGWAEGATVLQGLDIRLGSSAATSPVALAPLVQALWTLFKTWLDLHVHTGGVLAGALTGPPTVPSPAVGNVGAVKTKAE